MSKSGGLRHETLSEVLLRHRHEKAKPLEWDLPVDRLQDQPYCNSLIRRLQEAGREWEVLPATPDTHLLIPRDCKGIYMFVWRTPFQLVRESDIDSILCVLYVGKANGDTSDLQSRYRHEYSKLVYSRPDDWWSLDEPADREERLARLLSLASLEYWFLVIDDDGAPIESLETELIQILNPPGNARKKLHRERRLVKGKPEPAF